ncbi:hypothetical protein CFP56_008749 [Quercus suber]|uniref:Uncharacterized protein n=1 Tax=Quercus suber TaxID=58331 RepID=A0AAW0M730_QUESU
MKTENFRQKGRTTRLPHQPPTRPPLYFLTKITITDHHHHLDIPHEQPFHVFLLHRRRCFVHSKPPQPSSIDPPVPRTQRPLRSLPSLPHQSSLRLSLSATRTLSSASLTPSSASLTPSFSSFCHPKPHSTISSSLLRTQLRPLIEGFEHYCNFRDLLQGTDHALDI